MSSQEKQLIAMKMKLVEAMERMQTKKTLHIPPDSAWNKANLAREAQINKDTLCRKRADGSFVYAEANRAMERGPGGPTSLNATKKELRARVAELEAKVVLQSKMIAEAAKLNTRKSSPLNTQKR